MRDAWLRSSPLGLGLAGAAALWLAFPNGWISLPPLSLQKSGKAFHHQLFLVDLPAVEGRPQSGVDRPVTALALLVGGKSVMEKRTGDGKLLGGVKVEQSVVRVK